MSDHIYKKAESLWSTFSEKNEEKFWPQYEKLVGQEKENYQKNKNAVTHHFGVNSSISKTDLVFYPKGQKLLKTWTDFRDRYQISNMNDKFEGIRFVAWIALFPSFTFSYYFSVFLIISLVVLYLLSFLNHLNLPQYITITKENLVFHNFQKDITPVIKIDAIYSIAIIYNSIYSVHKMQIETASGHQEFEYKLGKKVHQEYVQYFKNKSIPFDDRYYKYATST